MYQRAFSTAAAVGVALGGRHPAGWFEALLGDKAAAKAVNAKVEKMRMSAQDKKTLSMVESMQREARGTTR